VRALLAWNPHVVVDLHEMGGDAHFYFPPAALPGNPHTTREQQELFELFGRANAALFDQRGWPYFIREIFDAFYPGYGGSWANAHGALAKTFEQGSARGLEFERYDGTLLTYEMGVEHNFNAALRTALTAAENRERLLRSYVEFRRGAIAEGQRGTRAYVLDPTRDAAVTERLARTLVDNGIEVRRAEESFRVGGRTFPVGTFVVPLDQPAGRVARNLLDPHTPMDPDFVELQRQRRAQRLPDQIYDVTAWSLPLLWNVEAVPVGAPVNVRASVVTAGRNDPLMAGMRGAAGLPQDRRDANPAAPEARLPEARVGYLLPWNSASAAVTVAALAEGIPLHAAGRGFVLEGRGYGVGTIHLRAAQLDEAQRTRLAQLVALHGAEIVPVNSAFVDEGISLGSNQMRALPTPRVMMLWDAPTSSLSAGSTRWVLERRFGQPVTALRVGSLPRADLSRYTVIVMPSGNYAVAVSAADAQRLRTWVQGGGTLITLADATRWAGREDVGLLATRAEMRAGTGPAAARADSPPADTQPIDLLEMIAPESEAPEPVTGAILRAVMDTTHVLAAGSGGEMGVMVSGSRVFTPLTLDQGTNVGVYAPLDQLVLSGIVWEEARPQLASKAFLMHQPLGRGRIIAFAEDPNFRGYAEGTQLLFINAVLFGGGF
jgi:hypothetical protein